ncbi:phage portal protein family protein [Paeniglutamicibacter sp. R2-26]|uniref:phage portal protein family protein n=1 Tax=Paeniglutamicibacter sp. R2-26 TaxID=3144417 RepID=UPI003EE7CAFE
MADQIKELGNPGGIAANSEGKGAKAYVVEPLELNPDLAFPNSIPVFDEMRRTNGQVGSTLRAMTMPIISARWDLLTDGIRPEVAEMVRAEVGLTKVGEATARRRRQGIVFKKHLKEALLCLPFGFMPFEQVYEPGPPMPGQENSGLSTVLHLRKLAPRLPRTITNIHVGRDGGLAGVSQAPLEGDKDIFIPVTQLVMYVLDQEGADWSGTSILRTAYKHHMINNKLHVLGPQIVERNGMGVPVLKGAASLPDDEKTRILSGLRAGALSHAFIPADSDLDLKGVTGSLVDPLPWIQHHDQMTSKSMLAMFLDLGHDAGARSLGETFLQVFNDSLQAVADMVAETFTEHVIRDLVELNYGPEEPYPTLTPGDLSANKAITSTALKELIDAGVIQPDAPLEAQQRAQRGLPELDPATVRAAPAKTPTAAAPAASLSAPGAAMERASELVARLAALQEPA